MRVRANPALVPAAMAVFFRAMKPIAVCAMITICMTLAALAQEPGALTAKTVVQEAQQRLRVLGYDPGETDGTMGNKTLAAVKQFQSDHGLPVTGVLDQRTLEVLKGRTAQSSKTDSHAKSYKGKTPPHSAVSEADEWNRALLRNSVTAYMNFHAEFPETRRLAVLQGTLEAVVGGTWQAGQSSQIAFLRMNGSDVYQMSLQEAMKWDLVLYESVGQGGYVVKQRPAIPNAKIIMLKEPDKIVCIDTNGGIHEAARNGDLEKVEALVKDSPDLVLSKDKYGATPLLWAAGYAHKDIAEFLLANKAEVNHKANDGETPLHYAAANGHKDVAESLLANKAEVNAKDNDGHTPLHWAAGKGYKDVAELLLANKAEVNAKDNNGLTPLHYAAAHGHKDLEELLRQHGGHE